MRRSIYACFVTVIALAFLLVSCGKMGQKSPSDVVKSFCMALNDGKYLEAEKYLEPSFLKDMKQAGAVDSLASYQEFGYYPTVELKEIWDEFTRNGTLERIEILKEEIKGDMGKVNFRLYFKDGSTTENIAVAFKMSGIWKIFPDLTETESRLMKKQGEK
jgi:hypothetical protein